MKSILIKDTTKEEREEIIRDPECAYDDYIKGRRSFEDVSSEYAAGR